MLVHKSLLGKFYMLANFGLVHIYLFQSGSILNINKAQKHKKFCNVVDSKHGERLINLAK